MSGGGPFSPLAVLVYAIAAPMFKLRGLVTIVHHALVKSRTPLDIMPKQYTIHGATTWHHSEEIKTEYVWIKFVVVSKCQIRLQSCSLAILMEIIDICLFEPDDMNIYGVVIFIRDISCSKVNAWRTESKLLIDRRKRNGKHDKSMHFL